MKRGNALKNGPIRRFVAYMYIRIQKKLDFISSLCYSKYKKYENSR